VPPGHSESAIEEFVFDTKRGYCEQFAGTYARDGSIARPPGARRGGFHPG